MIRNLKVVLLWLCTAAVALPSSGMIRQSATRQTQKSVRTKSDSIKPTGKTPTTATGQPVIRKQTVQPQSGRSTTVAAGGPSIHILSPTFGVVVQGSVTVTGFVDNLVSGLSSVTVNGNTATIDDQRFTATVTGLTTGQTQLIVNASDGGGNNSTFTQPLTVDTDSPVWANVSPEGINARWIVVDPSNPQTLYVASSQLGIVKSTNGGKDWYRTGSGLYGALTVDPANSNVIYLVTGAAVLKSTDAGMSWTLLPQLAYSVYTGPPVIVDPFDSQHLLLARGDAAFESHNGGQSWQNINALPQPITAVAFDPFVNGTIYAGGSAVFKSVDNGINWTSSGTGMDAYLNKTTTVFGFYPDPLNPGVIYGENTSGRVFKTVDSATTWVPLDLGIGIYGDIEFDRTQAGVFCISSFNQVILRTTDNGATWTKISSGIPYITDPSATDPKPEAPVNFIRIDPSSSQTIYATTSYGIFKSTNSGATWNSANKNLYGLAVTNLATSKTNPLELTANTLTGELYKSIDGGQTWSRNRGYAFHTVSAIDPVDPNIQYFGSQFGNVDRTIDGGLSWHTVFVAPDYPNDSYFKGAYPSINCVAVNPKNPSIVYVGTNRSIYRSVDHGTTWAEVHRPESSMNGLGDVALSFAIDPLHPNMVYAATSMSVLSSFDMGATWSSAGPFDVFLDPRTELKLDPNATNNFYIASFDATIVSPDRGHTWKNLPKDFAGNVVQHLVITNDNPSTVFGASGNGGISKLVPAVPKVKIALGDVNRDGVVNVADLSCLANGLAGNILVDNPQADLSHNGEIDIQDMIKLAQFLAGNTKLN